MKTYKIAILPGDGVGKEVITEGMKVLHEVSRVEGTFKLDPEYFPWGCEHYLEKGTVMPEDGMVTLKKYDAIYLGAIGHPDVPDYIGAKDLVLKIRKEFNQYVNLRPIRLLPGIKCPLKGKSHQDINMLFIRENTEGEYVDIGGAFMPGTPQETVLQTNIFTRQGTERIMRYAFTMAKKRTGSLTSVTKSNALKHSMVFWDRVFDELAQEHQEVKPKKILVDAMAMFMVLQPENFDVVVASNLFGDILTDLGAGLQGGLGFCPGANINPEKEYPSMFEPIHGSAPDIAGKEVANPIAAIWAGGLMLEHLGETRAAQMLLEAIEDVCSKGLIKTRDMGGINSTSEMGNAIAKKVSKQ